MMASRAILERAFLASAVLVAGTSCKQKAAVQQSSSAAQPGTSVTLPADVRPAVSMPAHFRTIGRNATPEEIRAWNIDANAEGIGLPPGQGTYARGAALFAERCSMCHGAHGEGIPPYPRLIGREPRDSFPFGRDAKYVKTIGNYWPYATTVFDYVNRAMPLTAPGSLGADNVYSVVAFLLAENEVVDRNVVIDARTLPKIHMPARGRFVRDDRTGTVFR